MSAYVTLCWAQAPGDEETRCTVQHSSPPSYPDTERNLMDSYNYQNLLPGNGTGNPLLATAVWNDYSFDENDDIPAISSPTFVSYTHLISPEKNFITQTFTHTQWQHGTGGLCRFQVRVCGWKKEGTVQNNWLFTQHISKDFNQNTYPYNVEIKVQLTYSLQSCRERNGCVTSLNLLHYVTNTPRLPSAAGNGFMNRDNYVSFAEAQPPRTTLSFTHNFTFNLQPSQTGFYLAMEDHGTCIGITRLRVYRNNCKPQDVGLVVYPSAPAPVSGSVNIDISCVENAVVSGSPRVTCSSDGTWGPQNPVCQCRLGYEDRETECVG